MLTPVIPPCSLTVSQSENRAQANYRTCKPPSLTCSLKMLGWNLLGSSRLFRAWATCLLAWPCSQPFPAPQTLMFQFAWPHWVLGTRTCINKTSKIKLTPTSPLPIFSSVYFPWAPPHCSTSSCHCPQWPPCSQILYSPPPHLSHILEEYLTPSIPPWKNILLWFVSHHTLSVFPFPFSHHPSARFLGSLFILFILVCTGSSWLHAGLLQLWRVRTIL